MTQENTYARFTLKSGAEITAPMPPGGMNGFVEMMEKSGLYENPQVVLWPEHIGEGEPTAVVVVSEIAAIVPVPAPLTDRTYTYPSPSTE